MNRFPDACHPPQPEVVIDAFPFREFTRQHLPRDATADQIKDCVEDFTHIQRTRAASGFRFRDESFKMFPFAISQVTWVTFLLHFSSVPDWWRLFRNALSLRQRP